MGHLNLATPLVAGDYATPARLNGLVQDATLAATNLTGVLTGDLLVFLRNGQLYNASWATFKGDLGANGLALDMAAGVSFVLKPGGATNVIFEQSGGSGSGNIPVQLVTGAANNSLYIAAAGVGVLNSTPAYALDVNGDVRGQVVLSQTSVPTVGFRDTDTPTGYSGAIQYAGNSNTLYIGTTPYNSWGLDLFPIAFNLRAANNTLVVDSGSNVGIGTAAPAYKFDVSGSARVTGNITLGGSFVLGDVGTPPASNAGGTVGTLMRCGTDLYLCVAASGANSWKKVTLATY